MDEENKSWTFDAYQYDLKSFDQDDEQVDELSGYIADALCGKRNYAFFKVTACSAAVKMFIPVKNSF